MRVTNKMLAKNFLRDMKSNLNNMKTLQQQMTSGKEIRRPSDNPFKVARAMQLHTDINANKQYRENIRDTINWLDTTDTALDQAGNVLQRVRELLISAGNAAYGDNERRAIKDEINERMGELTQILNTNFDGKYIFGGTRGTTKPVDVIQDNQTRNSEIVYHKRGGGVLDTNADPLDENQLNMLEAKLSVEISQGVTLEYNVTAKEVLEFRNEKGDTVSLIKTLSDIVKNLSDPNSVSKLTNEDLTAVTDSINNILRLRSEVGAKQNRMESALAKNIDENFNMTEILSHTEDIDITEKTMQYAIMQTVYMASLQTSARVLQPTLMDYLR
jgi:flagellar hook-associated protein 3 FlgL